MIILEKDWTFTVAAKDAVLGYMGENAVQTLQVKLLGTEYANWDMVFDVMQGEMYNIWPVEKTIAEGNLILSVLIKKEYVWQSDGVSVQLRAAAPDGRIKKSALLNLRVNGSVNTPDVLPSPLPAVFEEYESRIINLKEEVERTVELVAESCPYIGENDNWYEWDMETDAFIDSGVSAHGLMGLAGPRGAVGPQGPKGDPGPATNAYTHAESDLLLSGKLDQCWASVSGHPLHIPAHAGGLARCLILAGNSIVKEGRTQNVTGPVKLLSCGKNLLNIGPARVYERSGVTFQVLENGSIAVSGEPNSTDGFSDFYFDNFVLHPGVYTASERIYLQPYGGKWCSGTFTVGETASFRVMLRAQSGDEPTVRYPQIEFGEQETLFAAYHESAVTFPLLAADTTVHPDELELPRGDIIRETAGGYAIIRADGTSVVLCEEAQKALRNVHTFAEGTTVYHTKAGVVQYNGDILISVSFMGLSYRQDLRTSIYLASKPNFAPCILEQTEGFGQASMIDPIEQIPFAKLSIGGNLQETLTDPEMIKSPENPARIDGVAQGGSVTLSMAGESYVIPCDTVLYALPDGERDEITLDGSYISRVGKIVLNGTRAWTSYLSEDGQYCQAHMEGTAYDFGGDNGKFGDAGNIYCVSDCLSCYGNIHAGGEHVTTWEWYNREPGYGRLDLSISVSRLSTPDTAGLCVWLSEHPVTVYYKRLKPIVRELPTTTRSALQTVMVRAGELSCPDTLKPYFKAAYAMETKSYIDRAIANAVKSAMA
ncbi:collagen-like protein [Clostridium sp. D33t1_170424_F3]|uniref:collagen-like triple helix repeat-containing protein n=1 Tax=Clostridium sp. D33t1_170424_F3 TaxID=2787099 RepID=UPI0018AA6D78|nr:collagen-like protein [Clostridium sp. D33t1_170424_F3]